MYEPLWSIRMLGGFTLRGRDREITRFRTQKAAALLAYVAYHSRGGSNPFQREALIDMLWPELDLGAGRHNFSTNLTILRHLLEPAGVPPGSVVVADRYTVRLGANTVDCDVHRFETAASRLLTQETTTDEVIALARQVIELYGGVLLPGFYEDWVSPEALRLSSLVLAVAAKAVPLLVRGEAVADGIALAQRAVLADGLSEEAVLLLMKALKASGQPSVALGEYAAFEQRFRQELGNSPSDRMRVYASKLRRLISEGTQPAPAPAPAQAPPPLKVAAEPVAKLRGDGFLLLTTTRFFDRESEIGRLEKLLCAPRVRLVTVTGVGGTGKTRLAVEASARIVESAGDDGPSQAVFIPLADVTEAGRIVDEILRRVGKTPTPDSPLMEQLERALRDQPSMLLVLDNFEQLAEVGAAEIQKLLANVPRIKCLITSRQRLHIDAEHEFPLSPLPRANGSTKPEDLIHAPSIALLLDRAQAARPDFQLTPRNASSVAELCDHLEGLPHAIELAAARLQLLSVEKIFPRCARTGSTSSRPSGATRPPGNVRSVRLWIGASTSCRRARGASWRSFRCFEVAVRSKPFRRFASSPSRSCLKTSGCSATTR